MTYLFYSIRASPAQMRCEPSCTAYLFPHFCHRFAPPKTTSLPKKFFSFAVKRCIMLLECAAFCFLWEIFVICQQSLPLQFIPARGRKLFAPLQYSRIQDCNLSPRGDENQRRPHQDPGRPLQFIPARGRKPICSMVNHSGLTLQFIPARGRKLSNCSYQLLPSHCNLSPRGDENTSLI